MPTRCFIEAAIQVNGNEAIRSRSEFRIELSKCCAFAADADRLASGIALPTMASMRSGTPSGSRTKVAFTFSDGHIDTDSQGDLAPLLIFWPHPKDLGPGATMRKTLLFLSMTVCAAVLSGQARAERTCKDRPLNSSFRVEVKILAVAPYGTVDVFEKKRGCFTEYNPDHPPSCSAGSKATVSGITASIPFTNAMTSTHVSIRCH
jgi:hypothetical protein